MKQNIQIFNHPSKVTDHNYPTALLNCIIAYATDMPRINKQGHRGNRLRFNVPLLNQYV
jgi:hypothetical protein